MTIEQYIKKTLNISIALQEWKEAQRLPIYLRQRYKFFLTRILSTNCLLIVDVDQNGLTPATIDSDLTVLKSSWPGELIYVHTAISSYNRDRLIKHKIPFIAPGAQMFLPMIGIDLREHFKRLRETRTIFSPATQALILNMIYGKKFEGVTPSEMAKDLGYSPMTMTRTFDELQQAGIGEHLVKGKVRSLRVNGTGASFWEDSLPYLRSPVKVPMHIADLKSPKVGVLAGLSAVAHYSSLAEPRNTILAIDKSQVGSVLLDKKFLRPAPEPGTTEIQVWFYSPLLFSKKSIADPLSVFLSLKDDEDERTQSALVELMEGIKW
jgi:hypothetical protein